MTWLLLSLFSVVNLLNVDYQTTRSCIDRQIDNPLQFSVTIDWYAYDSIANRIASYRNDNLTGWAEDMIATMYGESALNPERVARNWDSWVCQRSPIRHSEFINSAEFNDYTVQAKACLEKRVALKYEYKISNYRKAYSKRNRYKDKIIYHLTLKQCLQNSQQ